MKSVAVLQARTSSSRLPGKVLLPIKEVPLAVLAAKRAANTGRKVIVATSKEPSDDSLASIVKSYGFECFRGSLHNTLNRFVDALSNYSDDTIVFRLTGDNVFPDGVLLDEIEEEFVSKGLSYMCCNGEPSGLPYGMSAEITYLKLLREAVSKATGACDFEHVTPYIIRKFGFYAFDKYADLRKGHFRCTVDCFDDYLNVQKIFSEIDDIFNVSSFELVKRLKGQPFQPCGAKPVPKLVLGTAQLGMEYGVTNSAGVPEYDVCQKIIKTAIANGVLFLDTAHAYGDSEKVIGQSLFGGWQGRVKIITKLSPLEECPKDAPYGTVKAFVDASVYMSCSNLGVRTIDVMMLHRASHLQKWGGAVWRRLLDLKKDGTIRELGVSVQSPEELKEALSHEEVSFIQMPLNIFDWRWQDCIPEVLKAKASRKLVIHVRSALLQGVLLNNEPCIWKMANVDNSHSFINWLKAQVDLLGRQNILDLCLNYLRSISWVDGIVVGVETMSQLYENISIFSLPVMNGAELEKIEHGRPVLDESSLNPALWNRDYR